MKKKKTGKIIALSLISIIIVALISIIFIFSGELTTLMNVKLNENAEGVYELDYAADYKLDDLLEKGGASSEEELVQYILKVMLKGLPINIEYEIPELGCSTFIAQTPEKGYIFGRNFDNQTTDLLIVKTSPKGAYKSVSVSNLSFIGYNENQCATNFYLHEVPFEYEEQGKDRYEKLVEVLSEKNGVLSADDGMGLLNYVSIEKTEPDEEGRVYSTQWSSIYDLNNPKLIICVDRDYENPIEFTVE